MPTQKEITKRYATASERNPVKENLKLRASEYRKKEKKETESTLSALFGNSLPAKIMGRIGASVSNALTSAEAILKRSRKPDVNLPRESELKKKKNPALYGK